MHLSRASSIVLDRKERCSRPSFTTAPTPWGPPGRNRHTHASFRYDEIRGRLPTWHRLSLSPTPALPLHLRDPSRSCWTDAVFNIKTLAFFGVDRGVPGCPFPPRWHASLLPISSSLYFDAQGGSQRLSWGGRGRKLRLNVAVGWLNQRCFAGFQKCPTSLLL